jgi:hypothetical protein
MSTALLLLFLAQSPGPQVCPVGQLANSDTSGHCCWPGQVWSGSRKVCVGVPSCPGELVPSGDACISVNAPPPPPPMPTTEVACAPGAVLVQGVCCWPGQWVQGGVCAGQRVCPAGTAPVGNDCVARAGAGQPPPPPPPMVQSQPPAPAPDAAPPVDQDANDPYLKLNHVFFSTVFATDFSAVASTGINFGLQVHLDVVVYRHRAFSVGVGAGGGFVSNWPQILTSTWRYVAYFPIYAQFGVRLGSSLSEFVVRAGGAPAYASVASSPIGKFMVGGGFLFRWGNGGGVIGFDLYAINGLVPVVTVGFIF